MSLLGSVGGGNLFSTLVSTVAQAALATVTGGASALIQAALTQVISSIGQQVLQQVGQALNLPQSVIDLSIGAFAAATGNSAGAFQSIGESAAGLAQATGGGAFEAGGIERQMNDIVQDLVDKTLEKARTGGRDEEGNAVPGGLNGKSFMLRLALALGSVLDAKMERMAEIGEKIDAESQKKKPKMGSLSAEMTAVGKELDFVSQALNNALKSIGESASTLARKQG
ncbi:hypothetical protein O3U67_13995 [Brevundimonas diminuta]|jgi:hypothetical protein|uniref:hypothetical protein n=1 Tax=Brevundimonas TaxID=41275 RepID=UPI0022AF7C9C|nr:MULTISPECIES: hypothetical protein [Brevundimonas]MCZ4109204.1 hypothetical protein [Brevundimonas diminuta]